MLKRKTPETNTTKQELSDKQRVLKIQEKAKLHTNREKTKHVVSVGEKVIATAKKETDVWKRALHALS